MSQRCIRSKNGYGCMPAKNKRPVLICKKAVCFSWLADLRSCNPVHRLHRVSRLLLGSMQGLQLHGRSSLCLTQRRAFAGRLQHGHLRAPKQCKPFRTGQSAGAATVERDVAAPRLIQHKAEAFWFYRFLSIVYDHIVNPGHWTEDMRTDALEPAKLTDPNLKVLPYMSLRV